MQKTIRLKKSIMKRNTISGFVLAFLLISTACTKNNTIVNNRINGPQTVPGIWELRSVNGRNNPNNPGNFEPGNGNLWSFTNTTYSVSSNGSIVDSGTYTISNGINPQTGSQSDALLLDSFTLYPLYFDIINDTLTFYNGIVAADGTINKYVRIENYK